MCRFPRFIDPAVNIGGMIDYIKENVTLLDDGSEGIYLVVRDVSGPVQQYAILPAEVAAIHEVTNKWLVKNQKYNV